MEELDGVGGRETLSVDAIADASESRGLEHVRVCYWRDQLTVRLLSVSLKSLRERERETDSFMGGGAGSRPVPFHVPAFNIKI